MSALVGRDAELAALRAELDAAAGGSGRLVLLSGAAGIGKSRLAAEALSVDGFAVLQGRGHPLHSGLAYAPVVEAVRPQLATMSAVAAANVLAGLDDLGRLLAHPALPAPPLIGDPDIARTRMFEAVAELLRRLAARTPTVLFIDDLHWADQGTVELVHYVGHGASGHRLLVLGSYRSGEETSVLRDLAVHVRRDDAATEVVLAPLDEQSVADLARQLLTTEPSPQLLQRLTARANGVPLFVTALVQSGQQVGAMPAIVRDVVLGQLQRLDERERRLMETIAVAGDDGHDTVLSALWRDGDLDVVLRRLLDAGLVVEQATTYRVAHPLYAEVAYAELTMQERRAMHAALAVAIGSVRPDDVLALAPHYLDAGDLGVSDRAVEVLGEAGRRALRMHAYEEAERYLDAALVDARARGSSVVELLHDLTRVQLGNGRMDDAAQVALQAIAEAERLDAYAELDWLRYALSLIESERGNLSVGRRYAELPPAAPGAGPAAIASRLVSRLNFASRHGPAVDLAVAAQLLVEHGDDSTSGRAAWHLGRTTMRITEHDYPGARQEAERALDYGEQIADRWPALRNRAARDLLPLAALTGDLPAALRYALDGQAHEIHNDILSTRCSSQHSLSWTFLLAGDGMAALTEATDGYRLADRSGAPRSLTRLLLTKAFVLAELGRTREAEQDLETARNAHPAVLAGDQYLRRMLDLARLAIAANTGRADGPAEIDHPISAYDVVIGALVTFFDGRVALLRKDPVHATHAEDRLRATGRTAAFADALADRVGGLRLAADHADDAYAMLQQASDRLEKMGTPVLAAQASIEALELAAKTDIDTVHRCLDVFQRAGAVPWVDRTRQLARSFGIRVHAKRAGGPLTRREQQVVELLRDGLSNAEIATRLFLSERTVETHLRNAYARLGITSRIALARWAAENTG